MLQRHKHVWAEADTPPEWRARCTAGGGATNPYRRTSATKTKTRNKLVGLRRSNLDAMACHGVIAKVNLLLLLLLLLQC